MQAGKEGAKQSGAEQQRERLRTRLLGGSLGGGESYSSACPGLNNGTLSMN